MLPCVNGTSRSFSCARSFLGARTRVTGSRSRASPVCRKRSSIVPKIFCRIWKSRIVQSSVPRKQRRDRQEQLSKGRNRSLICCREGRFTSTVATFFADDRARRNYDKR